MERFQHCSSTLSECLSAALQEDGHDNFDQFIQSRNEILQKQWAEATSINDKMFFIRQHLASLLLLVTTLFPGETDKLAQFMLPLVVYVAREIGRLIDSTNDWSWAALETTWLRQKLATDSLSAFGCDIDCLLEPFMISAAIKVIGRVVEECPQDEAIAIIKEHIKLLPSSVRLQAAITATFPSSLSSALM